VLVASVSDNLATNILLAEVGLAAFDELRRELGLEATTLLDIVRDERGPEHPTMLSAGSAAELSRLMIDLTAGRLVSAAVSTQLTAWLATGVDLSLVASAFGLDPLAHTSADGGYNLINKTGTDRGVRADVGAVAASGGRVAYAVIVNWEDADPVLPGVALAGMREIGSALRRAITI
jgi:beta-lactamase class A